MVKFALQAIIMTCIHIIVINANFHVLLATKKRTKLEIIIMHHVQVLQMVIILMEMQNAIIICRNQEPHITMQVKIDAKINVYLDARLVP